MMPLVPRADEDPGRARAGPEAGDQGRDLGG
jgi:hypothetical protein